MAGRVLSTQAAKDAITQLQSIITGGLANEIAKLDAQGKILSNPENWDGPLAETFRNTTWPETHTALTKAQTELEELRQELGKISTNIFTAGGGA